MKKHIKHTASDDKNTAEDKFMLLPVPKTMISTFRQALSSEDIQDLTVQVLLQNSVEDGEIAAIEYEANKTCALMKVHKNDFDVVLEKLGNETNTTPESISLTYDEFKNINIIGRVVRWYATAKNWES